MHSAFEKQDDVQRELTFAKLSLAQSLVHRSCCFCMLSRAWSEKDRRYRHRCIRVSLCVLFSSLMLESPKSAVFLQWIGSIHWDLRYRRLSMDLYTTRKDSCIFVAISMTYHRTREEHTTRMKRLGHVKHFLKSDRSIFASQNRLTLGIFTSLCLTRSTSPPPNASSYQQAA